jgi:D-methionine transport system ATP-binding protein
LNAVTETGAFMSQSTTIVEFKNAEKYFSSKGSTVKAVDGVSLQIQQGEIYGVIGYSGAGKSTLVRMINALEPATGGNVIVDGHDLSTLGESALRKLRLEIGMIFQQFNLLQSRTVSRNVAYPLEVAGVPRAERKRRVAELLEFVGLTDKAKAYPSQLSGGQKQRVGIARALATSPKILLADESTSALDPETTNDVLELLAKVNRELGITVVVITHEMEVVKQICDRVAVMENGKVVEEGTVYQVFSQGQTRSQNARTSARTSPRTPGHCVRASRRWIRTPHHGCTARKQRARWDRVRRNLRDQKAAVWLAYLGTRGHGGSDRSIHQNAEHLHPCC